MQDIRDILEMRVDRTKIPVSDSFDNSDEKEYRLSRTPQERLAHLELLHRICYGEKALGRLDKSIFEVVRIDWK